MFTFDFADVKPSVLNWFVVGMLAITFIVVAKFVVNKFDNPIVAPFKEVVSSV